MSAMNSVFRIENDILLLNTYFNPQMYKNFTYHPLLALATNPKTGYVFNRKPCEESLSLDRVPASKIQNAPALMPSYTKKYIRRTHFSKYT